MKSLKSLVVHLITRVNVTWGGNKNEGAEVTKQVLAFARGGFEELPPKKARGYYIAPFHWLDPTDDAFRVGAALRMRG